MALKAKNKAHASQISAGTKGRNTGHSFEKSIANDINQLCKSTVNTVPTPTNILKGNPGLLLVSFILNRLKISSFISIKAYCLGDLATSETKHDPLIVDGIVITKSKSDILIVIDEGKPKHRLIGVSVKQCNTKSPTNAQLYFTTARAFLDLLEQNCFSISPNAITALRQFCGDIGFRPIDNKSITNRITDNRRFFWEEIDAKGRIYLENLITKHQAEISKLLLQKAYSKDPISPEFVMHKTRSSSSPNQVEVALYSIDELIGYSCQYRGFELKPYSVRKGSFKDPSGVTHLAPRFGIIQMQRGGQAQHPEQLQFNLESGYFYKLQEMLLQK